MAYVCKNPHIKIYLGQGTESDPSKVGCLDDPDARIIRIVHISDTHLRHEEFLPNIPHGDILVHSGDFISYGLRKRWDWKREFNRDVRVIDDFFGKVGQII